MHGPDICPCSPLTQLNATISIYSQLDPLVHLMLWHPMFLIQLQRGCVLFAFDVLKK